ncbi:hypothetical protein JKP88DRAFT_269721 [Tribonema minus]|uniref:DUF2470 domain-containing protein n=1 Tax=Tribonema minus TaxID=303371 RepID=A0A836CG39_9STRA|nr:hypothetical protein JKP88DRAFT_269721 [Tribonema minus]
MSTAKEEQPTGHQPRGGGPQRTPEQEALSARIQEHQRSAARLTKAEEVKTLVAYSTGFGVLSTNSKKLEGYPNGSVVGFGLDDAGRPLFAFSTMSAHTSDLGADGRASMTIMAANFKGASDGRVTLIGDVGRVPEDEIEAVRTSYKVKHPNAFWVDFGDFSWFRMDTIKAIRFVGGFAMAGDITSEDYLATKPDPIAGFAEPIMTHMNSDHSDSTAAMVEHYITGGAKVDSATLVGVDRKGMNVLVAMGGESGKLRLPFPSPADDRKAVKDRIVEMTRAAAPPS